MYTLNPKILAACPKIQIRVAVARYVGPGANPTTLTLNKQSTTILSAAHPHSTLANLGPLTPSCAKVVILWMMLPGNRSAPHTVPRSVDHISDPIKSLGGVLILAPGWGTPDC